jgi:serine/threonine protein kinase
LKPDNIGFDVRGDVKIFDFGLSRQMPSGSNKSKDGTYKMTGDTGSPRYMAPEVALQENYNESSDVYSFAILMFQMLALETPFEGFSMAMFEKKVVREGCRPRVDPKWPQRILDLIQKSWSTKISERPTMEQIVEILRAEISEKTDENLRDNLDTSGRTQHSLHEFQNRKAK